MNVTLNAYAQIPRFGYKFILKTNTKEATSTISKQFVKAMNRDSKKQDSSYYPNFQNNPRESLIVTGEDHNILKSLLDAFFYTNDVSHDDGQLTSQAINTVVKAYAADAPTIELPAHL